MKRACRDCDSGIKGIRGCCLEHRAQVAEKPLETLRRIQRMAETGEHGIADLARAAIAQAQGSEP